MKLTIKCTDADIISDIIKELSRDNEDITLEIDTDA